MPEPGVYQLVSVTPGLRYHSGAATGDVPTYATRPWLVHGLGSADKGQGMTVISA